VGDFVEALRQSRVLEPQQIEEIAGGPLQRCTDARALARELIDRSLLTPYQVNQMFLERGQELVLGQYVLLERLGEGAMGQVFKARHRSLGRIVALKLIRKERLSRPEVVQRFLREVQIAAQLKHPNVVLSFDAGQVGATHFIAMEYVDGIDLARLVKRSGPLSVEQASDFICQAAQGLQHASEQGLVHRDIKPANLFVTRLPTSGATPPLSTREAAGSLGEQAGSTSEVSRGPLIKILDMGLARLNPDMENEATPRVTKVGVVVGTIDFLAPEQAVNASRVDIRADIYSLGCTFYYLLTGSVPFSGATAMEKLLKHRCDEPPPVEQRRPEVSDALAAVVRKMMAKRADDRYQTPADVALAISAMAASGDLVRAVPVPVALSQPISVGPETGKSVAPTAVPVATVVSAQPGTTHPAAIPIAVLSVVETAGPWDGLAVTPGLAPKDIPPGRRARLRDPATLVALAFAASVLVGILIFLIYLLIRSGK
jgi:serine/threonine-protein kinase